MVTDVRTSQIEKNLTNLGTGCYPPLIQSEPKIDRKSWEVQEALNGRR